MPCFKHALYMYILNDKHTNSQEQRRLFCRALFFGHKPDLRGRPTRPLRSPTFCLRLNLGKKLSESFVALGEVFP